MLMLAAAKPFVSAHSKASALRAASLHPPYAAQNLREAIASYRGRIFYEANDTRRQSLLQVRCWAGL